MAAKRHKKARRFEQDGATESEQLPLRVFVPMLTMIVVDVIMVLMVVTIGIISGMMTFTGMPLIWR